MKHQQRPINVPACIEASYIPVPKSFYAEQMAHDFAPRRNAIGDPLALSDRRAHL
jgi:hypothetical protein